ncbi:MULTISPECIES: hypothetical protein [Microbacterium]|uniref:hypothetical protein n=1 Tax=Microbacterium TaxID=33882 RepID=UPI000A5C79CD|nr:MULTISPECIES: hypothetical protein [Microbacterium]QXE31224.1 hypothetical protein IZR02_07020 [Microbacterium paraoxydans]
MDSTREPGHGTNAVNHRNIAHLCVQRDRAGLLQLADVLAAQTFPDAAMLAVARSSSTTGAGSFVYRFLEQTASRRMLSRVSRESRMVAGCPFAGREISSLGETADGLNVGGRGEDRDRASDHRPG